MGISRQAGDPHAGLGADDLLIWLVSQFNPEALVDLRLVLGIRAAEGGQDVLGVADEAADVCPGQGDVPVLLAEPCLGCSLRGLGLGYPACDERGVGSIGQCLQRGAVGVQLAVALSDLAPGSLRRCAVSAVLGLEQVVGERGDVRPGRIASNRTAGTSRPSSSTSTRAGGAAVELSEIQRVVAAHNGRV
jgi:hypothetical protein